MDNYVEPQRTNTIVIKDRPGYYALLELKLKLIQSEDRYDVGNDSKFCPKPDGCFIPFADVIKQIDQLIDIEKGV